MSSNERWNTTREIERFLPDINNPHCGAGPILFNEKGIPRVYDGEGHAAVYGNTGAGKTQTVTASFAKNIAEKHESGVFVDSKGELLRMTGGYFSDYKQRFCFDFSNPLSSYSDKWNPLALPYRLFKSKVMKDNDLSSELVYNFWNAIYPTQNSKDPYWETASQEFATGLTYALFEEAEEKNINVNSVARMIKTGDERTEFRSTRVKDLYNALPEKSLGKYYLASYVNAPNETAGSINAVSSTGVAPFFRNKSLLHMLCDRDTIDLTSIDVTKPFVIYIILPPETHAYDILAATLITQITTFLFREAKKFKNQRLPIRVNYILEELGSIAHGIPDLDQYISQGRGFNLRYCLVLQSKSQLENVYGRNKALTIESCIGVQICLTTNNGESREDWSRSLGKKAKLEGGMFVEKALITPTQLGAMEKGKALVTIENRYKFITKLPFFYKLYECKPYVPSWKTAKRDKVREFSPLDFRDFISKIIDKHFEKMLGVDKDEKLDMDDLVKRIDRRIAELEKKEKEELAKKRRAKWKYFVCITDTNGNAEEILDLGAEQTGMGINETMSKLTFCVPFSIAFKTKKEANAFLSKLRANGVKAEIKDAPKPET